MVTKEIKYIGVDDLEKDFFEGQYKIPKGMAYNSYIIIDEKIAVIDSVEANFTDEWLGNIQSAIGEKTPDYLIVQHMEPDHSGNIVNFVNAYPKAKIVSSAKSFNMMQNFFGTDFSDKQIIVCDGDTLSLGKHQLTFLTAPMVHWPEVIVTYDSTDKVLFSADAFGKFGAHDVDEPWVEEARRYYVGIVSKYGMQVQNLLKKIAAFDVEIICPLHGPSITENLKYYIDLYDTWSSYRAEEEGVVIAYTSVYGNTKKAVIQLAEKISDASHNIIVYDLARCDMSEAVADAFRYSKLVLATTTYNADIFPFMREFIDHLVERNYSNRTVGLIENGSWVPLAAKIMRGMLEKCKDLSYTSTTVNIVSSLNDKSIAQLDAMAQELCS